MTETMYNRGKLRVGTSSAWTTGDVRALLLAGGPVPVGAHDPDLSTVAALLAVPGVAEAVGPGYARIPLTLRTVVEVPATDRVVLDADDAIWPGLDCGTVRAVVLYLEGPTDATRELVSIHDGGFPKTTNGGAMSVVWDPSGVLYLT